MDTFLKENKITLSIVSALLLAGLSVYFFILQPKQACTFDSSEITTEAELRVMAVKMEKCIAAGDMTEAEAVAVVNAVGANGSFSGSIPSGIIRGVGGMFESVSEDEEVGKFFDATGDMLEGMGL